MSLFDVTSASEAMRPRVGVREPGVPPAVQFRVDPGGAMFMRASPPGAFISCECYDKERAHVGICTVPEVPGAEPQHIAHVMVSARGPYSITEETMSIACAIYWSWWRSRDSLGDTPSESTPPNVLGRMQRDAAEAFAISEVDRVSKRLSGF